MPDNLPPDFHGLLGRRPAVDARDQAFLARAVVAAEEPPLNISRYFAAPSPLPFDQKRTSSCVAHAWTAAMVLGPLSQGQDIDILAFYRRMLEIDEFEGEADEGTSTRAGAKVFQEHGFISEYRWGRKAVDARQWMQREAGGPVIIGVNWYTSMFKPDAGGYLRITTDSVPAGGHEVVLCGYSLWRDAFRGLNSWGRWGQHGNGQFWLESALLDRLMEEDGDMCMPLEQLRR